MADSVTDPVSLIGKPDILDKTKGKEIFQYEPLPAGNYIRLLEMDTEEEGNEDDNRDIQCSLKVFGLDGIEDFDALSYTWGMPLRVFETEEDAEECQKEFQLRTTISVDGKVLEISKNLHDALSTLHQYVRPGETEGLFVNAAKCPRSRYIWIDAICINQGNDSERSSQVAIMDLIYKAAQSIIIWLGRKDVFTVRGMTVLHHIGSIEMSKVSIMRSASQVMSGRNYDELGLPKLNDFDWLCVYAVLNRNWFRRAWILQEASLARRCVPMCGTMIMSWSLITSSCRILELSKWYSDVRIMAANYMKGKSSSALGELINFGPRKKYLFEVDREDDFDPCRAIVGITATRASLHIEDEFYKFKRPPAAKDMTELLQFFRFSSATDPHDKVYALLGLLPQSSSDDAERILPDYAKDIETVYLEATWYQLRTRGDLSILGHVQDASKTNFSRLPSWVPDFSCKTILNPLSEIFVYEDSNHLASSQLPPETSSPFSAGGQLPFNIPKCPSTTSSLHVHGIIVDTVAQSAIFDLEYDLWNVLNLLANLPHLYWNDIMAYVEEHSPPDEAEDDEPKSFVIENGYLVEYDGLRLGK
jgi:hypothetical protein